MGPTLVEAIQISIISIGIVFASLLCFSLLIQLMGHFFQKQGQKEELLVSTETSVRERKQVAAIMTAFQEEFGDQLAEIKISKVNRKGNSK